MLIRMSLSIPSEAGDTPLTEEATMVWGDGANPALFFNTVS